MSPIKNKITYPSGKSGLNVKIRQLLEYCGIDRKVKSFDAEKNDNVFSPIFKEGSSKLCRSTHVDMMSKVQLDSYAAGYVDATARLSTATQ